MIRNQRKSDWFRPEGFYDEAHQFLFFAVLEGCYTDGLNRDDIEQIIPNHEDRVRIYTKNFIISCPICQPVYDGFVLYADRNTLSKQTRKPTDISFNTFGQGLDKKTREQLAKGGQPCRDAIKDLIQKWVDARIAKLRLTEQETKELRDEFAKRRKKGEEALQRFKSGKQGESIQKTYYDWEEGCPNCLGASPMGPE